MYVYCIFFVMTSFFDKCAHTYILSLDFNATAFTRPTRPVFVQLLTNQGAA